MKVKELLNNEICYFRINLSDLPFKEAGLKFDFTSGYCRVCSVFEPDGVSPAFMLITGIYNYFTHTQESNIDIIKTKEFFIPQKLCFYPSLRGANKLYFIGSEKWRMIDFPHMSNVHSSHDDDEITHYFKDGYYAVTIGVKTPETYVRNVRHLEDNTILTHEELKLYLFIEVLKIEKSDLSERDLEHYAKILDEYWKRCVNPDDTYSLPQTTKMVKQRYRRPIFTDLPLATREKVIPDDSPLP